MNKLIFTSTLIKTSSNVSRYDLRLIFTVIIIAVECLYIILKNKPAKKYPTILSTAIFNFIAIYLPIHGDSWDSLPRSVIYKYFPIISFGVIGLKLLLCVGLQYSILKQDSADKKKLLKSLLAINLSTSFLALIIESLIFGEFRPFYGFG